VYREWGIDRELPQTWAMSLMTQRGCEAQGAAKRCVSGAPWVSRVVGAHPGHAAMCLGVCMFVPGLRSMVQSGVEQELRPPLSLMTWRIWRTHGVLLWAHGAQQGSGEQAGGDWEVWGAVVVVAGEGGADGVCPESSRHVRMNTSALGRVAVFAGLWTTSVHCLLDNVLWGVGIHMGAR
jgi:hypothetical protein